MPEILIEVEKPAAKTRWTRLCGKMGTSSEETLTTLIDTFRDHEKILKERDFLKTELDHEKEAFRELEQKTLEENDNHKKLKVEEKEEMTSNPDSIRVLSEALTASKEMLDFYARENKRLLEKVNHSEYDEKIIGLQKEIEKANKSAENYKADRDKLFTDLNTAQKQIKDMDQSIKSLENDKTSLEKAKTLDEDKISDLENVIRTNRTVLTAQHAELEKLKSMSLPTSQESTEHSEQPN